MTITEHEQPMVTSVRDTLVEGRIQSGLGLREVSRALAIPPSTLWRIEQGLHEPRLSLLRRLIRLYGINVNIASDGELYPWDGE